MTDSNFVPDTFVSGLGGVEDVGGGCYRFTFYSMHHGDDGDELTVVSKLVAPMEAVPPALLMAAKAIGLSIALGGYFPKLGMN